jgi:calnexin
MHSSNHLLAEKTLTTGQNLLTEDRVLKPRGHVVTWCAQKLRWVLSEAKKDGADDEVAKYDGEWSVEAPEENGLTGDLGLVLKSKAKHHGVSVRLERPYEFRTDPFIVQYEIKFQDGQECGGAYIKLLSDSDSLELESLTDKTPYTIMFGPDKCGETDKVHFIFRHQNPKTGEFEEKHSKQTSCGEYINDKKTHVYTLIVSPDNTYEILIDQEVKTSGSLLSDEDFK